MCFISVLRDIPFYPLFNPSRKLFELLSCAGRDILGP